MNVGDFILTIDIDWAPDWMIEYIAKLLIERKVKATWYITHFSEIIELLVYNKDLFELGIHPNCLCGSTHGDNEDDVLKYVKAIVPDAISMRTHGLYQSTTFLVKASSYGIKFDNSLFLPKVANLAPHYFRRAGVKLCRIPYFYEDDCEMFEEVPVWSIYDKTICNLNGLKVFDFHPHFVVLNNNTFDLYEKLKVLRPLLSWSPDFVSPFIREGIGPKTIFLELIDLLAGQGKFIREMGI